jgi:uncharacterized protein YecE (DUF72 family)
VAQGISYIGCAGWSLPRLSQVQFSAGPHHLGRYATRLNAAEINSSFYRGHSRSTYERWAASVPDTFRFSVKLPRAITHERRFVDCEALLDEFLAQAQGLGSRLGCLLVQLPPSMAFGPQTARTFFEALRRRHSGPVAVEPRHGSWFEPQADGLLAQLQMARVLADPVRHEAGRWPGGWPGLVYLRLHGSPRIYYSAYDSTVIETLARRIALAATEASAVWCIFDNTASGAAVDNALALTRALTRKEQA